MSETTAIVRVVEEDRSALHVTVQTPVGVVTVMANVTKAPGRLILSRVHVEGEGLTRVIIKQAAKEIGRKEGVAEVLLQGAMRTSGARPGSIPSPIRIKVDQ